MYLSLSLIVTTGPRLRIVLTPNQRSTCSSIAKADISVYLSLSDRPCRSSSFIASLKSCSCVIRFQDKLSINISDSQFLTVSLSAYGSGTTIVSEPPLAPAVRLGPQFSCQPVSRMFQLTNRGRRPQQIYWSTEGFPPFRTRRKPEYNPEDMKYQVTALSALISFSGPSSRVCISGLRLVSCARSLDIGGYLLLSVVSLFLYCQLLFSSRKGRVGAISKRVQSHCSLKEDLAAVFIGTH